MILTHYALDYLQALELNSIQRQNIRNEVVCYCIRDKRITTKEAIALNFTSGELRDITINDIMQLRALAQPPQVVPLAQASQVVPPVIDDAW